MILFLAISFKMQCIYKTKSQIFIKFIQYATKYCLVLIFYGQYFKDKLFQIMILTTAVYEIYSLPWPMSEVHLYWLSKEPLVLQDPTPSN